MNVSEANAAWQAKILEVSELEKTQRAYEASAKDHRKQADELEQKARDISVRRDEAKKERDSLAQITQSGLAIGAIQQAQQEAAAANAQAKEHLDASKADREEAAKLREEATKLLEELKAAKAEKPVE